MSNSIYFEIDPDVLDKIVSKVIEGMIIHMKGDLAARKRGVGPGYLHADQKEDILAMREHIKAFALVLKYFKPPSEIKDVDQAKPNRAGTRSGTRSKKVRGGKRTRTD